MSLPKPKLRFIGIGGMGSRMAQRLLDADYPLTVYNRTKAKTQSLAQQGASVADSARELAAASQIVISCVADDAVLHAAMFEAVLRVSNARCASASRGNFVTSMFNCPEKIS